MRKGLVPGAGIEPALRFAKTDFKSVASADFATRALNAREAELPFPSTTNW